MHRCGHFFLFDVGAVPEQRRDEEKFLLLAPKTTQLFSYVTTPCCHIPVDLFNVTIRLLSYGVFHRVSYLF
uniref:Uncharacterized protein n=1 Tax=Acrobeloides nanus TaxID=290746 RepID=A0A914EIJ0_9BILA